MFVPERMLPAVIAERAAATPDALFIEEVEGPRATYGELHELSLRWASALEAAGVGAGDRVATMLPTGVTAVAVWLALGWLRAVEAAFNTDYRGDMLDYALSYTRPRAMVTDAECLEQLAASPALDGVQLVVVPDLQGTAPNLACPVLSSDAFLCDAPNVEREPPGPWDLSCLIFTSGTTGPSKGVLVPWGMLFASAHNAYPIDQIAPDDVYYCPMPFYHVLGRYCVFQMAVAGCRLVTRRRFSAREFWSDVRRHDATMAFLFGAVLHQAPESPDDAANPLRVGFMAPLIAEYEAFAQRFGIEVRSLFGMTELGVGLVSDGRIVDPRSCGRPIRGVAGLDVRLVDEHDNEVPVGEVGELVARTSVPWTLNAGYFEMPEATARAWRNGWFHTGDGFRRDEAGDYYFVDRLKDYIRRRGENISAFDLERVVNQHPAVLESAAIAAPSETSEDEVKIVVVRRPGATLTAEGLVGFLLPRLPVFMVPRYIELVEELPRTPTMKVRKVDLRATALNSATWDRRSGAFLGLAAGPPQREGEAVSRAARVEGLVLGG